MVRKSWAIWGMLFVLLGAAAFVAPVWGAGHDAPLSPDALTWERAGQLPQVAGDGVAFILGDRLYHAGGWAGDPDQRIGAVYSLTLEPGTMTPNWVLVETLPGPARLGAAVAVYNSRAYVIGGYGGAFLDRVDIFNGSRWDIGEPLVEPLNFPAVVAANDYIYLAGGLPGPSDKVRRAKIEDGYIRKWESVTPLPRALATRLAANGQCLYVIGGRDSGGDPRSEIYAKAMEEAASDWDEVGSLPLPLALHGVAVHRGSLYVLGGETTDGAYSALGYRVDLNAQAPCGIQGTWQSFALPSGGLRRMAVAARWGELYMIGGEKENGTYTDEAWLMRLEAPAPTLDFQKAATPGGSVGYGARITYTLRYHNPWPRPEPQTGVRITDTLPEATTFVAAAGGVEPVNGFLDWTVGELASDAGGEVSFTVETQVPSRTWTLTTTRRALTGETGTHVMYRVAYTLTGEEAGTGMLITHTLPQPLVPVKIQASAAQPRIAVRGRDVVWRVLDAVDGSGYVTVTTCISGSLARDTVLTGVTRLDDLVTPVVITHSAALDPGSTSLISHSCSWTQTHVVLYPTEVPPLYPDVSVRNQAWIYSDDVGRWQSSNVVVNFWPTARLYLPLTVRDS